MLKVVVSTTLGLTAGAVVGSVVGSVVTVGLLSQSETIRKAMAEALVDKGEKILFGSVQKKPTVSYNFCPPYRPR